MKSTRLHSGVTFLVLLPFLGDTGLADVRLPAELPPMNARSEPLVLQVKGNNLVTVEHVLVGEVWLCSGRANMEWPVRRSSNADAEIAAAKYPLIRHLKVPHCPSTVPLRSINCVP